MTGRLTLTRAFESAGMQSEAAERIATEIPQLEKRGPVPLGRQKFRQLEGVERALYAPSAPSCRTDGAARQGT